MLKRCFSNKKKMLKRGFKSYLCQEWDILSESYSTLDLEGEELFPLIVWGSLASTKVGFFT